jgi:hypothetical protein
MKERLLTALALLSGILLLSASIVWETAVCVINSFRSTQAYNYERGTPHRYYSPF